MFNIHTHTHTHTHMQGPMEEEDHTGMSGVHADEEEDGERAETEV